jgi:PIN domain nuclease of toxin-antitoxin system
VRLLLDTQIAVWAAMDDRRLGDQARAAIEKHSHMPAISVATLWEIAIKFALGTRRRDPMPFSGTDAKAAFESAGYLILPVTAAHAAAIDGLPPLHGDPFDRMLVAQAKVEGMTLLTRDERLGEYGAFVMVV